MKIAVVCDVLGKENNGTTIAAMNLIRSLRKKGHEVRVVCSDADKKGRPGYYVMPGLNLGPLNGYVAKNGVVISALDKKVLEDALHDVDIVHVMIPFTVGSAAAKYAHRHGIPLTAGFHCQAENFTNHIFMKDFPLANDISYRVFYHNVYRYCDCVHYPTQFICDVFEGKVGQLPHCIISNGVGSEFRPRQTDRPRAFRDKYVVLFTGRYSREKSHKVLIDAVALSRYRNEIQLIFAGAGPQAENLLRRAKRRGILPPVMKFYGRDELVGVINCADLYVHPAEIEIEAISALEAIACGRVPLISDSPRSATRYFALSKRNLFKCNDPLDLAVKMDWWLGHPSEREECAKQYLGYASRFDFQTCMDRMEEMLIETAEKKKGKAGRTDAPDRNGSL